jgi:hypothetical protein
MKKMVLATVVACCAALAMYTGVAAVGPNTSTVVTPANFATVFSQQTSIATSSSQFVTGPATPPAGVGSLEVTTTDSTGHQQFLETGQANTLLSAIDEMAYSTYRHSTSTGTATTVVSINMAICTNVTTGTCGFTTLVFEPYLNPTEGAVTSDTWQNWDAYNGGNALWHSTHAVGNIPAGLAAPWSQFLAQAPAATVLGYGPNQGSANDGIISNVDALSIGTATAETTYDFEPAPAVNAPEAPMTALLVGLGIPAAAAVVLRSRRRRAKATAA